MTTSPRELAVAMARAQYARTGVGSYSVDSFIAPEWAIAAIIEALNMPRESQPAVRAFSLDDVTTKMRELLREELRDLHGALAGAHKCESISAEVVQQQVDGVKGAIMAVADRMADVIAASAQLAEALGTGFDNVINAVNANGDDIVNAVKAGPSVD